MISDNQIDVHVKVTVDPGICRRNGCPKKKLYSDNQLFTFIICYY